MPRRNLVSNIGFGEGARHTVGKSPLGRSPDGRDRISTSPPWRDRTGSTRRRALRLAFLWRFRLTLECQERPHGAGAGQMGQARRMPAPRTGRRSVQPPSRPIRGPSSSIRRLASSSLLRTSGKALNTESSRPPDLAHPQSAGPHRPQITIDGISALSGQLMNWVRRQKLLECRLVGDHMLAA